MTMGTGVVLFVIGAILTFAVHVGVGFISLTTAGWILMIAGVVVFFVGLAFAIRGRRTVTTARTADPDSVTAVRERTTTGRSDI